MIDKGSRVTTVELLIHDDILDEDTECFTAELGTLLPNYTSLTQNISTICLVDIPIFLCFFTQAEYYAYESNNLVTVTVTIDSTTSIQTNFTVDVDTIYGIGSASGK